MDYEQFVADYTAQLQSNMEQDNISIQRIETPKVNEMKDSLSIRYPDSPVAPTIHLQDEYEFALDGYTVEELAERKAEQLINIRSKATEVPELTPESAKKNLYCVVINAEANEELLKQVPHEKLEDLAVIPRFKVGEDGSFIVKNEMCQHLQMTSEEVMEQAHKNTEKQTFECQNMTEVMREIMKEQGMPDEYIDELLQMQGESCPMYVMSNESRVEGAVALTSTTAMDSAYEKIKEDHPDMENLFVLGSSRHELILIPDDTVKNIEDLKLVHKEVQDTELAMCDKLTNNIYNYNSKAKKLSIIDSPERVAAKVAVNVVSHAKKEMDEAVEPKHTRHH